MLMQYAVRPQEMYASIMLLAASGYLINKFFVRVEKHLIHWYALEDTRNEML
jgi:sulfonate transport system permease protein